MKSRSNGLRLGIVGTVMNLDLYDVMCDANQTIPEVAARFGMTEDAFTSMLFMQYIPQEISPSLAEYLERLTGKSIEEIFPHELRGRDDLYDLIEENRMGSERSAGAIEVINPTQVPFNIQLAQRAQFGSRMRDLIAKHLEIDESVIVTEIWLNECSVEDVAATFHLEGDYVKRVCSEALTKLSKLPAAKRLRRLYASMH